MRTNRWTPTAAENARVCVLLDEFLEAEAGIARLKAVQARILTEARQIADVQTRRGGSGSEYEHPVRAIAAEFAAAARIPDRTIRARMEAAVDLLRGFPATFARFEEGRISEAHAKAIVATGERIEDDDARAEYETILLRRAETMTAAQLRALARSVADRVEPLPLQERHEEAMATRGVWAEPLDDGMAEMRLVGPAPVVFGIHDRVTQMARAIKRTSDGDDRTLAQIRADVLADLALTGAPTEGEGVDAIKATIQITIPVETLTGLSDESAFLTGCGPIDPQIARRLAGNASTWARLFVNPDTGALLTVDAYTPTAAQKRFLTARDEHCRFPGCRQPAMRSDIDHTIAYSERGPTDVSNLGHVCRAHHVLKHNSTWQKGQGPDGETIWISPTGRIYRNKPTPVVRFEACAEVAMPEPAPF